MVLVIDLHWYSFEYTQMLVKVQQFDWDFSFWWRELASYIERKGCLKLGLVLRCSYLLTPVTRVSVEQNPSLRSSIHFCGRKLSRPKFCKIILTYCGWCRNKPLVRNECRIKNRFLFLLVSFLLTIISPIGVYPSFLHHEHFIFWSGMILWSCCLGWPCNSLRFDQACGEDEGDESVLDHGRHWGGGPGWHDRKSCKHVCLAWSLAELSLLPPCTLPRPSIFFSKHQQ